LKVMILCGGQGTRLRELTEVRPKPMVEIGGRPILWHIMKLYAHHGIADFILCLGYKGAMIKEYFLNYEAMNSDFTVELGTKNSVAFLGQSHAEVGWKVTLADTGESTMTGGRISRASRYLDGSETFAVTYGDGVTDADLTAGLAYHRKMGRLATLLGVRPPGRFGELVAGGGLVSAFNEKPQLSEGLINGGFFFFEPDFLRYVTPDDDCVLERAPLQHCAADRQLSVFQHDGYWQCMDTLRDWESLQTQWERGQAPWKVWA
jgi:glucose-1-phosphate cytidylyltransferase